MDNISNERLSGQLTQEDRRLVPFRFCAPGSLQYARGYVSRIEKKALERLRDELEKD